MFFDYQISAERFVRFLMKRLFLAWSSAWLALFQFAYSLHGYQRRDKIADGGFLPLELPGLQPTRDCAACNAGYLCGSIDALKVVHVRIVPRDLIASIDWN